MDSSIVATGTLGHFQLSKILIIGVPLLAKQTEIPLLVLLVDAIPDLQSGFEVIYLVRQSRRRL